MAALKDCGLMGLMVPPEYGGLGGTAVQFAEVSEILGIPIGTVKSRVHAAVNGLRKMLAEEDSGLPDQTRRAQEG